MTHPHLPNPGAALETSTELSNAGARLTAAMQAAIGQINAVGDPWGNDEAGNAYRASIGDTRDIQEALLAIGKGVGGFGAAAGAGVQRILDVDKAHGDNIGDIRV